MADNQRYPRGHDQELAAYLEKHTEVAPSGCWEWQRCLDSFGYGLTKWRGKLHRAHRLAYKTLHGYLTPRGVVVRHKCDNPRCCNPWHLTEGTRADNNRDRDRRGRHISLRGERHGNATLTANQVLEIRASADTSAALARRFGVGYAAVYLARRGYSWKHLDRVTA